MAQRTWTVNVGGQPHTVELKHGYFSGHRELRLDGQPVPLPPRGALSWLDIGGEHPFQIAGRPAAVLIGSNGLTFSYDLVVDGRSVTTGNEVKRTEMPGWGWGFVLACAIIPVVTVGGVVPVVIGAGGAIACHRTARDGTRPERSRAMRCAGITAACWAGTVAFLALLAGIVRATLG